MATVEFILATKGPTVHTIPATATVREAIELMNRHRVGCVLVMDGEHIAGIFTERDVLRRVAAEDFSPSTTPLDRVMTRKVFCCSPETDLDDASRIMRDRRIRHLPVCDPSGVLVGMISIGDLNAYHASSQDAKLSQLEDYVFGRG